MDHEFIIQDHLINFFMLTADDIHKTQEIIILRSEVKHPYYNNVNFLTSTSLSQSAVNEALLEITGYYKKYNIDGFCIFDFQNNSTREFLDPKHRSDPSFAGMHAYLKTSIDMAQEPKVNYKVLESLEQLNDWFIPFAISFGFEQKLANDLKARYKNLFKLNNFKHFIAYIGNKPVGAASIFVHNNIAGFYNLGVLAEYRGLDIGKNMQALRINYALEMGINEFVIQAVPTTEYMASQFNFIKVTDITPIINNHA